MQSKEGLSDNAWLEDDRAGIERGRKIKLNDHPSGPATAPGAVPYSKTCPHTGKLVFCRSENTHTPPPPRIILLTLYEGSSSHWVVIHSGGSLSLLPCKMKITVQSSIRALPLSIAPSMWPAFSLSDKSLLWTRTRRWVIPTRNGVKATYHQGRFPAYKYI